jgi:hypothetical protein
MIEIHQFREIHRDTRIGYIRRLLDHERVTPRYRNTKKKTQVQIYAKIEIYSDRDVMIGLHWYRYTQAQRYTLIEIQCDRDT